MTRRTFALVLVLVLHLYILFNLQFTAWPEMLSFPYLFNRGFNLYKDMVHPYPPLLTVTLANIYELVGYQQIVLKAFTWGLILINDLLIFVIAEKLSKSTKGALLTVALYAGLQPFLDGNQLWFDLSITTPLLFGLFFTLNRRFVLASLFFGLSVFVKQTGLLFFLGYVAWIILRKVSIKTKSEVIFYPACLFLLFVVLLLYKTSFVGFFNWVVLYPSHYWTAFPGYVQLTLNRREISIILLIIFPSLVAFLLKLRNSKERTNLILLFLFCVLGIISIFPRFSFLHFQTALPFLLIFYSYFFKILNQKKLLLLLAAFILISIRQIYIPALTYNWHKETRFWSQEDIKIANKIPHVTSLYLLGVHSGIYVLSGSVPPKPWVDNYGWYFEMPYEQAKTIQSWEQNMPHYIIWKDASEGNWYDIGTYQPMQVVNWINDKYKLVENITSNIKLLQKKE